MDYEDDSTLETPDTSSDEETWTPYQPPEPEPEPLKQYAQADTGVVSDAGPQPPEPEQRTGRYEVASAEKPAAPGAEEETFKPWTPPTTAAKGDEEETFTPYTAPESGWGAMTREVAHGAGPAAAAAVGGVATGAALGSAGAGPVGTLVGGLVGGAAAGYGATVAQEKGLNLLGHDDALQRAANAKEHPWWAAAGTGISNLAGFGLGLGRGVIGLGGRAISGLISGAGEAGSQAYQGKSVQEAIPPVLASTAAGVIAPVPRAPAAKAGEYAAQAGQAVRDFFKSPPPPAPIAPAAAPPAQGQLPFPPENVTPQPFDARAANPPRPAIGGGEAQPSLPLEPPRPPEARPEPQLPLEPPPVVDQQGQLGLAITAPDIHSRPGGPPTAGVAREATPPSTGTEAPNYPRYAKWPAVGEAQGSGIRGEPEAQPHSAVDAGLAADAAGAPPGPGRGINVLQPGQGDPTVNAAMQARVAAEAPPPPTEPAPPRTSFEAPAPALGPQHGPPPPEIGAPIPPARALVPRVPETAQGVTEPPVPAGRTRLYRGDPRSETAYTTDREAARRYGPTRHVDVSQDEMGRHFQPGRESGDMSATRPMDRIYNRRLQDTQPVPTEPVGRIQPRPADTEAARPPAPLPVAEPPHPTARPADERGSLPQVPEVPSGRPRASTAGLDAEIAAKIKPAAETPQKIPPAAPPVDKTGTTAQRIAAAEQDIASHRTALGLATDPPLREYHEGQIKALEQAITRLRGTTPKEVPPRAAAAIAGKRPPVDEARKAQVLETAKANRAAAKAAAREPPKPGDKTGAREVVLERDEYGNDQKVKVGEETTFEKALEQHGTREGLIPSLTEHIVQAVKDVVGKLPVFVVPRREMARWGQDSTIGSYSKLHNHIILNDKYLGDKDTMAHAVLHEGVHAVTAHAIVTNPKLRGVIDNIMFDTAKAETAQLKAAGLKHLKEGTDRAFVNAREWVAEAFSNPRFQQMLQQHEVSPETARAVRDYAGGKTPIKTAWDGIVNTVRELLNVPPEKMNALEATMRMTEHAIAENKPAKTAFMERKGGGNLAPYSDALPAPKEEKSTGKVIARDKFGNEATFTGETVHAAAAKAMAAKYSTILNANGTPYTPPKAAPAAKSVQAAITANTAKPAAGAVKPAATPPGRPAQPATAAPTVTASRARIMAQVASSPPWHSKFPTSLAAAQSKWREFYTGAKNALDPIEQIRKAATTPIAPESDFHMLARLTKGLGGRFEQILKDGTYDIGAPGQDRTVNGKSLNEVIKPIQGDPNGFTAYALAKRSIELEGRGIKTGMPMADARAVVAADGARFEPVFRDLVSFQDRVLQNLVKSGILNPAQAAKMTQLNKEYVPFYRLLDPKSELGVQLGAGLQTKNPIFKIKGSDREVFDPIDSIIKNTYAFTDLAERNRALVEMKNYNDTLPPDAQFMVRDRSSHPIEVQPQEIQGFMNKHGIKGIADDTLTIFRPNAFRPGPESIRVYENGKPVVYKVPEALGKAVNSMDRESLGLLTKIMSTPARMLRAGAVLSPEFMLRNPLRDMLTAFIQARHGSLPVYDFAVGLKDVFTRSKDFQEWQMNGGANANLVSMDRRLLSMDPKSFGNVANMVVNPKQWLGLLQHLSELSENATRVGVYKRARGKGVTPVEAAYESREASLDFARMGASSTYRALNSMIPFFNAQIEGVDRAVRAFRDKPLDTTIKVAASITAPSVALWFANKDNERVQELPQWQKDLFWIVSTDKWVPMPDADRARFPADISRLQNTIRQGPQGWERNDGNIYRIPKPFEIGVLFGSVPERILDSYFKDNPHAFKNLDKSIERALTPGIVPQAVLPFIEQWANRSMFLDRSLLTEQQAKLPPAQQFGPHTSETAKVLGTVVRAVAGEKSSFGSPIMVDNYIRQWSGGLGQHVTSLIDAGLKSQQNRPVEPTMSDADKVGLKAFIARYPGSGAQSVQDFYDERADRKMEQAGIKAQRKTDATGANERAQKSSAFTGEDFARVLKADRDAIDRITNDRKMSADDKRSAIDLTYLIMIEHAKRGNEAFERSAKNRAAAQ